jgi:outer membrane protein assembly factor BamB
VLWRKQIGQGFAGPAVAGGHLILHHRIGREEIVDSIDPKTGTAQWRYSYPTTYRDDFGFDEGPRAVPVVVNGRVYTFGAEGELTALDLAAGRKIWNTNVMRQFGVDKGFFGQAGSPLVEDGRVILNAGGADRNAGIVALDADTGAVLWTATNHDASYSSGTFATLDGTRTAVFLTREGLVGLDPATGAVRFQQRWRARMAASVNAATPLVIGDLIFISASYSTGATVVRVSGGSLTALWSSDDVLSNHYATSVHREGVLYGFHGRQEFGQTFRAVDLKSGKVLWEEEGFGAGSVTLAGERLVIVHESGDVTLAAAASQGYRQLARARLLPAVVRPYPALADGVMYVRNENMLLAAELGAAK